MPATRQPNPAAGAAGPVTDRPAARPPVVERPLRRDAEANRRQILEAAGRLMAARGLAVPLEDIAAEAGVGIATLYRRFPTRDELVTALFQDRLEAYVAELDAAVAMADGWEALVWYLESTAARQIADRGLSELVEHDPGQAVISAIRDRIWPLAETLVARAKDTGRLRTDFSVSDLAFVQQMLVTVGASTSQLRTTAWRRYLTFLIDGLMTGRDRPTPAEEPSLAIDQLEALHAARTVAPSRPRP